MQTNTQTAEIYHNSQIPVHSAQDLTRGGPVAQIVLDEKVYALRITRAGKLILTK